MDSDLKSLFYITFLSFFARYQVKLKRFINQLAQIVKFINPQAFLPQLFANFVVQINIPYANGFLCNTPYRSE